MNGVFDREEMDVKAVAVEALRLGNLNIDRAEFLREQFSASYPCAQVAQAISLTPFRADISLKEIDEKAEALIAVEDAALAKNPAKNAVEYYTTLLCAAVKLSYLYGFPQLNCKKEGEDFTAETVNLLILFLGVSYGICSAKTALRTVFTAFNAGVKKKLVNVALTKGGLYPLVKETEAFFERYIPKNGFERAILVSGLSFKSCCERFKATAWILTDDEERVNE